jgi:hypothetical protein
MILYIQFSLNNLQNPLWVSDIIFDKYCAQFKIEKEKKRDIAIKSQRESEFDWFLTYNIEITLMKLVFNKKKKKHFLLCFHLMFFWCINDNNQV